MASDHTRPSDTTRQAEAAQARTDHSADRPPTDDEARAAESNDLDPQAAAAAKEATERGAAQKGEGRI
ncbi:MAG TPA: hypothetical protein VFH45_06145 [Acidimicrobiales bacterium]|nr:hypothetical protein [Acidimicrobiales bacterium]